MPSFRLPAHHVTSPDTPRGATQRARLKIRAESKCAFTFSMRQIAQNARTTHGLIPHGGVGKACDDAAAAAGLLAATGGCTGVAGSAWAMCGGCAAGGVPTMAIGGVDGAFGGLGRRLQVLHSAPPRAATCRGKTLRSQTYVSRKASGAAGRKERVLPARTRERGLENIFSANRQTGTAHRSPLWLGLGPCCEPSSRRGRPAADGPVAMEAGAEGEPSSPPFSRTLRLLEQEQGRERQPRAPAQGSAAELTPVLPARSRRPTSARRRPT